MTQNVVKVKAHRKLARHRDKKKTLSVELFMLPCSCVMGLFL